MNKRPAFLFYPGDWLKDSALSRATHTEKGVYIDMLCRMFECDEPGVLKTDGVAWTDQEVALSIGGDQVEAITCIRELIRKGIIARSESGAIYSRRMVRDEQKRKLCSEAGKNGGGNPKLHNPNGNGSTFIGRSKGGANGHSKGQPKGDSKGALETETEDSSNSLIDFQKKHLVIEAFERLWVKYPRRDGKKEALRHFIASVQSDSDLIEIETALKNYLKYLEQEGIDDRFVKKGSTWFNNWKDWVQWNQKPQRAKMVTL